MVLDAAKGIEAQTRKLFEVCRLRDIPIMTFINKMDREARDPFALLDEVADQLQLETTPLVWPVGMGLNSRGVFDLYAEDFVRFGDGERLSRNAMTTALAPAEAAKLDENIELVQAGLSRFDRAATARGPSRLSFSGRRSRISACAS